MKAKRIILHRARGRVILREREYFKGFAAYNTLITHPEALRGWEIRALEGIGVIT